jgi:hypothetical protein
MTLRELREHLRLIAEGYFSTALVAYGEVDMVKPNTAFVTLKTGSMSRPLQPITQIIDGIPCGYYPSRTVLEVNLFTKGVEIVVPDGQDTPYENTAVNDLTEFVNFINSPHTIDRCAALDIAITPKGNVLDVTALLNNTKWEYRAMAEFDVDFMQLSVGSAGILAESSIVYAPEHPNDPINPDPDALEHATVDPVWTGPSPSGGGSSELAANETGYFEAVEIEQEKEEKDP